MIKNALVLGLLLLILLTACVGEILPTGTPTLDATLLNKTAVSQVTADFALTQSQIPTQTLEPISTLTPIPTLDRTRPAIQSPTVAQACNRAAAGHPIDVSIPDGTIMAPGEDFSKTWRLENVGTCTWTRLYAVTFFSGNSLDAFQTNTLPQEVEPGEVIDVTVDMEAPQEPGIYQSNWMLSNEQNELFGIGPNGDAPFWVRIEVVSQVTETPVVTPTPTNTPVVYLTGVAMLISNDQLDLDSALLNPGSGTIEDLLYLFGGDPLHIVRSLNGAQWMIFGEERPTFSDCDAAEMTTNDLSFEEVPQGTYLCYRTSEDLPGRLLIEGFTAGTLSISYVTWAIP